MVGWGQVPGSGLGLVRLGCCLNVVGGGSTSEGERCGGEGRTGGSVGLADRLCQCLGIGWGCVAGQKMPVVACALSCAQSQPMVLGPTSLLLKQHLPSALQTQEHVQGPRGGKRGCQMP